MGLQPTHSLSASEMRYYTGDVFSQPRPADLTARAVTTPLLWMMLQT